jgi:protein tyrosine/serine phosphatase
MNKKFRKSLILLLISITFVFSSCATSDKVMVEKNVTEDMQPAMVETVTPEVTNTYGAEMVAGVFVSPDKYGNMLTSITSTELETAGLFLGDLVDVEVGGVKYTCPIVSTYSDVDVGEFLVRLNEGAVYFSINYGNCEKKTGAKADDTVKISMNKAGAYLLEYKTRHLTKSEERADYDSDDVFANFRTVETTNITPGLLYRSCSPSLGDARAPFADKLAEKYKIKTIVNMADSEESLMETMDPNSWYKTMYDAGHVVLLDMDVDYAGEEFGQSLVKGFEFMAANEPPFLIHCNEGKDRAGFASVIIESLMGSTLSEISSDYMVSYSNYYGVEKGTSQYEYISNTPYKMLDTISDGIEVNDANLSSIAYNYLIKNGATSKAIIQLMGKLM